MSDGALPISNRRSNKFCRKRRKKRFRRNLFTNNHHKRIKGFTSRQKILFFFVQILANIFCVPSNFERNGYSIKINKNVIRSTIRANHNKTFFSLASRKVDFLQRAEQKFTFWPLLMAIPLM